MLNKIMNGKFHTHDHMPSSHSLCMRADELFTLCSCLLNESEVNLKLHNGYEKINLSNVSCFRERMQIMIVSR